MSKDVHQKNRDERLTPEDDAFVDGVANLYRDAAEHLDAGTRSRLNRARQAALSEMHRSPVAWSGWRAVAVMASVGMVAVLVWVGDRPGVPDTESGPVVALEAPDPLADLDLLLAEESLAMFDDIEFLVWMDPGLSADELEAELDTVS